MIMLKDATIDDLVAELESRGFGVNLIEKACLPELSDGWHFICCGECGHYNGNTGYCYEYDGIMNPSDEENCSHYCTFEGKDPEQKRKAVYLLDEKNAPRHILFYDGDLMEGIRKNLQESLNRIAKAEQNFLPVFELPESKFVRDEMGMSQISYLDPDPDSFVLTPEMLREYFRKNGMHKALIESSVEKVYRTFDTSDGSMSLEESAEYVLKTT